MPIVGKIIGGVIDRVSRTAKHYYGPYWRDCWRESGAKPEETLENLSVVFKMYTVAPVALLISPFYSWIPRQEVKTSSES